jgi:hypothetical protein
MSNASDTMDALCMVELNRMMMKDVGVLTCHLKNGYLCPVRAGWNSA